MTKDEIIKEYVKVIELKDLEDSTICTYKRCVTAYLNWCEAEDIYPPSITTDRLRDFFMTIESNSYFRQMRGAVDNLYKFVFSIPYILNGIPFPKRSESLPDYFTPIELLSVFEAVKNNKQRVVLKLQYACALRVHEVVKIRWSDFVITRTGFDLKIIGKGSKHNYVPVPNETMQEIISVMGNNLKSGEYVFKGQTKEHYSIRSVQIVINRAMEICGILKDGSTHLLRHSRATHLIQSGASLRHVQKLLRHKSSRTTEIYTHLDTNDLRLVCEKSDSVLLGNHISKINSPVNAIKL